MPDLPRLRRPRRHTELTTQLETDRRQLDASLGQLRQVDGELTTLKVSLDDLRAEAERQRWRLPRT